MSPFKTALICLGITCHSFAAMAQTGKPIQKFTPPKVKTSLGKYADTAIRLSAEEAIQLLTNPLKITDAKNLAYNLASYQFAYKQQTVSEEEVNGQPTGVAIPSSALFADRFKTTPLPQLWQDKIKEGLQRGESLYFFDIAVKDAQGRYFFAPDMKIYIK